MINLIYFGQSYACTLKSTHIKLVFCYYLADCRKRCRQLTIYIFINKLQDD
jgi:hypothetical protein